MAYADDVAIVARAAVTFKVDELLEETAENVIGWLSDRGIELALQKKELLLPTRKRTHFTLEVITRGHTIQSQSSLKYLGIQLEARIHFKVHAAIVVQKADTAIKTLRTILPNSGRARQHARKLLATVPLSIILYGAPIRR